MQFYMVLCLRLDFCKTKGWSVVGNSIASESAYTASKVFQICNDYVSATKTETVTNESAD